MRMNRIEHGKIDVFPTVLGYQPFAAEGVPESEKLQ